MPFRLRITRSFSAVSAGTVSARETAARTVAIAPIRAGSTARRWRGTTSVSGRANDAVTAANAWSEVMLPTSTPEIVTPLAIVAGVVVVVPVVVVVAATTPADRPPAAARPSRNSRSRPTLLIPRESLVTPGISADRS